jgi:hypothetical protein
MTAEISVEITQLTRYRRKMLPDYPKHVYITISNIEFDLSTILC